MNLFDLTGKTALVTGSSSGIGNALAKGLSEAGARIILNARNADRLADAATALREIGAAVETRVFDVTDPDAVREAIDSYERDTGPIDILVNNAGMQHREPLEDFPVEMFDRLMRTNLNSAFYVGQSVARHMIGRGQGKIVNIASLMTTVARPGIAPYTASKGAIGNLTKGMATDWAKHGLNCNAIAPGYFKTPLNEALTNDPVFCDWLIKRTPAGRWGELKELVGACIFLTSEASGFVNGQTIYVDGGITACV